MKPTPSPRLRAARTVTLAAVLFAAVPTHAAAQAADEPPWTGPAPADSGFLATERGPLRYERYGTRGPAVLLLHGYAAEFRASQWRHLLGQLLPDHRVVGVDVRGHGRSAKPHEPAAYGVALADDMTAVLDGLGLDRAHLVGYSMGGIIALKAAALRPDRVASVTLIGQGWPAAEELRAMAAGADQLLAVDTTTLTGAALEGYRKNDVRAIAALVSAYEGLAVDEAALRTLPVPLLAVIGGDDPRVERVGALASVRPDAGVHILSGRTHGSIVDDGAYAAAVADFLAALAGR